MIKFTEITSRSQIEGDAIRLFVKYGIYIRPLIKDYVDESYSTYQIGPIGGFFCVINNIKEFKKVREMFS